MFERDRKLVQTMLRQAAALERDKLTTTAGLLRRCAGRLEELSTRKAPLAPELGATPTPAMGDA